MASKQGRVRALTVYLAVRVLVCVLQMVSHSTACLFVGAAAWLWCTIDRRHRLLAMDNLRRAFPGRYSEAQLHALVFANYRHFFNLLVEISHLPRKMHPHNSTTYFDMGPRERDILDLLRSDRPVLIVTGHFGNWELAGFGLGARGLRTFAVSRPLDNPYLESFLRRFRERMGQTMLAKTDLRRIKTTLAKGGKIAILGDLNAGRGGLMVDFFGRPASTNKGVAVLALQHHAPLLVVGIHKVAEPMRYRVAVEDIIYPEDYPGPRADAVRRITERHIKALERAIRNAPEQYFWVHNRWKHQAAPPRVAAARAA